ncbi:MAG: HK97 family phage prohead protease, partial [Gemmatimonadota bacterium]
MKFERLTFAFELKDAQPEDGTFSGRALVYGREFETMFGPLVIEPGAFADSIKRNRDRLKILWQHNQDEPIGRPLGLEDRPDGVHVRGRISKTTRGRDALILLRDRVVDELSAGVERVEEVAGKVSRLKRGELHEISLVTFGAAGREGARVYEVNKQTAQGPLTGLDAMRQLRVAKAIARQQMAKVVQPSYGEEKLATDLLTYVKARYRISDDIQLVWFNDDSDDRGRADVGLPVIGKPTVSEIFLRTGLGRDELKEVLLHELGHVAGRHRSASDRAER